MACFSLHNNKISIYIIIRVCIIIIGNVHCFVTPFTNCITFDKNNGLLITRSRMIICGASLSYIVMLAGSSSHDDTNMQLMT